MARPLTHIFRLGRWARILARHGALRGIQNDSNTPAPVKRLIGIFSIGTIKSREPDYAGAFRDIGPAAIKLGQTLATRPDLVGEDAARNLLTLQDDLPPVGFEQIRQSIEASFEAPLESLYAEFDPEPVGAASIAQVHRAVTTEGRQVAVKVLRPGVREQFARDIDTYEWAAAHVEAMGGEAARLRPRLVIANFKRWTNRELDLRREAASASELAEHMVGTEGYEIPRIDWDRTNGRVMTVDWIDGIKISNVEALKAAGHDTEELASRLVLAFLKQAIAAGFFHADMHQGNLFVKADGTIAAIDFGIMGRIDRRARMWLAEILYGLTTGNYKRVAEIHFEAQYVPSYHNVDEFATALRAVGEPMRGKAGERAFGRADARWALRHHPRFRHADAAASAAPSEDHGDGRGHRHPTQPEDQHVDTSAPYVRSWIRDELGPEAAIADRIREDTETLLRIPDLLRRIEDSFPPKGGAPEPPPLPEVELVWERRRRNAARRGWLGYAVAAGAGGLAAWIAIAQGLIG